MEEKITKIQDENEIEFISLSEAAKLIGYTPEYLNLLSRQRKLKAKKIGRNWYTKKEWLNDFLAETSDKEIKKIPLELEEKTRKVLPSFLTEIPKPKEKKEAEEIILPENHSNWLGIFAALSTVVVIMPLAFLGIYLAKNFVGNRQSDYELEKIYSENQNATLQIINENDQTGRVAGEEDNLISDEMDKSGMVLAGEANGSGIILASENFRVSNVNIGGDTVILENGENLPLEIYDVKSESFIANKKDEVKLVVSWKTNKMAISELTYSKNNGQDEKTTKENSYGFNHSTVLAELDPRTSYVYQIKCRDRWANENDSSFFGIYTASKPVSVFDLISNALNEVFGWALKK
jgi:hypothetical protein